MSYKSAKAAYNALQDKAKSKAAEVGGKPHEWLNQFIFQRFLARVFAANADGWLLKGGQALLVRNPTARYSRDIDIYRTKAGDRDEAVQALRTAAAIPLDDFIRFEFSSRSPDNDENRAARLTFDVYFGATKHNPLHVDVVISPQPLGAPEQRPLQSALSGEWPDAWPTVTLYPLVDHIADKICAMYETRNGRPSSRARDLVDLTLIARQPDPIDGTELQAIVKYQVDYRRGRGTTLDIPTAFQLPDETWIVRYAQEASNVPDLADYATLEQAMPLLTSFITPVLGGDRIGIWSMRDERWSPSST